MLFGWLSEIVGLLSYQDGLVFMMRGRDMVCPCESSSLQCSSLPVQLGVRHRVQVRLWMSTSCSSMFVDGNMNLRVEHS